MDVDCLSYSTIKFLTPLVHDYINQPDKVRDFFAHQPELEGFRRSMDMRKEFSASTRELLVQKLEKRYTNLPNAEKQQRHIEALRLPNTYTVTTGHQLCTFTGPLYFIYKILSVVKLAQQLSLEFPDSNFVPIYWMASEDHDFEEINHFFLKGKKLSWDSNRGGAVGHLSADLSSVEKELNELLGPGKNSEDVLTFFESLKSNKTWSEVNFDLVHSLLGQYGIVILDPDDADLKREFSPIMDLELREGLAEKEVLETSERLDTMGYKTQVHPRDINLFYLTEGARLRLTRTVNGVALVDGDHKWTYEEIGEELKKHPERFSPNVVTRPMYQECILPNISYTGGAGELSYWFQLRSAFEKYNIPFPILMLRNSAVVLPRAEVKRMAKLGLKTSDLFAPIEQLEDALTAKYSNHDTELPEEHSELDRLMDQLIPRAKEINPDLERSIEAVRAKSHKLIQNLEKKFKRSEKSNQHMHLDQLYRILESVFPAGVFQERRLNFSELYLRMGKEFMDDLIEAFDPLNPDITVLREAE